MRLRVQSGIWRRTSFAERKTDDRNNRIKNTCSGKSEAGFFVDSSVAPPQGRA
jgi:hypothetical protein